MPFSRSRRLMQGIVVATALALTSTIAACGSGDAGQASEQEQTRVFPADNGEITIPADPQRVVATGYAVPALIEAEAPLVGISSWKRGLPMMNEQDRKSYDELDKIAGELAAETNYEAIANANPDLIVVGVPTPVLKDVDVERLESIAPVVALGPTVPAAWRELSRKQADAAGALDRFDSVKTEYEQKAASLSEKYKDVLPGLKLAHVGAYGEVANGNFQREFDRSWGTNIANDIGAEYYGQVKEKGGGSKDVSEYPSIEELPAALAEAEAITYTVDADGSVSKPVQYVLDSELWKKLPAVQAGQVFPIRYSEAATYGQAMTALDALDETFAPLLSK